MSAIILVIGIMDLDFSFFRKNRFSEKWISQDFILALSYHQWVGVHYSVFFILALSYWCRPTSKYVMSIYIHACFSTAVLYIYIYVCVCVCVCIMHTYIHTHARVCLHMCTHAWVCRFDIIHSSLHTLILSLSYRSCSATAA